MTKYVTGLKRNQIIQRWLQGIEDPVYDVFPTKKEGKYIVKLRTTPFNDSRNGSELTHSKPDTPTVDRSPPTTDLPPESKLNRATRKAPTLTNSVGRLHSMELTRDDQSSDNLNGMANEPTPVNQRPTRSASRSQSADSTVNLEILEQLRSLSEELRNDRFMKEQKQYIKHVVNKELSKSRIRSRYLPDLFPSPGMSDEPTQPQPEPTPPEPEPTPEPEPAPEPPQFRSRIRRHA